MMTGGTSPCICPTSNTSTRKWRSTSSTMLSTSSWRVPMKMTSTKPSSTSPGPLQWRTTRCCLLPTKRPQLRGWESTCSGVLLGRASSVWLASWLVIWGLMCHCSSGGKTTSILGPLLSRCCMSRISRIDCLLKSERRARKGQLSTSWGTPLGSLVTMASRSWLYLIRLISTHVLSLCLLIWIRGRILRWLRGLTIPLFRSSIRKKATFIMKLMEIHLISRKNHKVFLEVYMITHIIIRRNKQMWKKKKKNLKTDSSSKTKKVGTKTKTNRNSKRRKWMLTARILSKWVEGMWR
jgi:hypothetical protein